MAAMQEIAREKAGIFKTGVPAFTVQQPVDALQSLLVRSFAVACLLVFHACAFTCDCAHVFTAVHQNLGLPRTSREKMIQLSKLRCITSLFPPASLKAIGGPGGAPCCAVITASADVIDGEVLDHDDSQDEQISLISHNVSQHPIWLQASCAVALL